MRGTHREIRILIMMTTTMSGWQGAAVAALVAAATKAGASLDGLDVKWATVERTWGDLSGLVVVCADDALRARAATFLHAWLGKNLPRLVRRTYETQVAVHEPRSAAWYAGKGTPAFVPVEPPSYLTAEQRAERAAVLTPAIAIPCIYYPEAD